MTILLLFLVVLMLPDWLASRRARLRRERDQAASAAVDRVLAAHAERLRRRV